MILIGMIALKYISYQPWNRVFYNVILAAPSDDPIRVFGTLEDVRGNEIPLSGTGGVWGRAHSTSEPEHLFIPAKLKLNWIAYRERKIYQDSFELPSVLIKQLFDKDPGYLYKFDRYNQLPVRGYRINISIAPGGDVSVFMRGPIDFQKEIAHFTAKEVDHWQDQYQGEKLEKLIMENRFRNKRTDSLVKNRVPVDELYWKQISKRYPYAIYLHDIKHVKKLGITFINEEADVLNFSDTDLIKLTAPMPSVVDFIETYGTRLETTAYTDSTIIKVFEKNEELKNVNDTTLIYFVQNEKHQFESYFSDLSKLDSIRMQ